MGYRDHDPVTIAEFNGLWNRGDKDETPMDHFTSCNNIRFKGENSFTVRHGIGISQDVEVPLSNVKRIYNYPTITENTLIVLTVDPDTLVGTIYHVVNTTTVYGPILTIGGMQDFAFLPYAGRGYISPFASSRDTTSSPQTSIIASLRPGSGMDAGLHKYAFTYVTAVGETLPSPLTSITNLDQLANPVIAPVLTQPTTMSGNALVNGGVYKWRFTYSRDGVSETVGGTESSPLTNDNTKNIQLQRPVGLPADVVYIGVYRTLAGGSTYYRVQLGLFFASGIPEVGSGLFLDVYTPSDTDIIANPTAPLVNNTEYNQVSLNNIGIGPATVTSRKVYRTVVAGSQLKLLTTLADNITTDFLDTLADGALGANAPIVNTAEIALSSRKERGLEGEFLYVYAGDGTQARKAAGSSLSGNMSIAHGTGHTDAGFRLFGFVSETRSGYLAAPGAVEGFVTAASNGVSFGNVPVGDSSVVKRHLVASRRITGFNGNLTGYTLYFVPNATIENNTDTFLNNISFYDADLLDDASHLIDNYAEIPAGAVLTLYRNRLVLTTTYNDISIGLVSAVGEPEAISQIDGIITMPPDGNPITNAQELRDILYVTKRSRTGAFNDNGDVPSSWPYVVIDNALGTSVHGIATVLDSGSSTVDFLIIATYQGVSLFNGRYITPELSMKIESFWRTLNRELFKNIQILNATIQKELYIILPNRQLLVGNYGNGLDSKRIRWCPWTFPMGANTIGIVNIDEVIIGADIF